MLSSLNIRHMRVFVAVADQGNFTAAAGVLGLGVPAVTATIRQFEDVTGAALFDRTTRQVALTQTGERFLPIARRLLADFEEALGDLDALSKGVGGKITIAAAPSVLTRILPTVISEFVATHPDARIRLDERNAGEVHEAVASNAADFGIAGEWQALPDIAFRPLFSDRFGVLCRADHAFAQKSVLRWSDLTGQKLVGLGPESGTGALMAQPGVTSDLSSDTMPVLSPALRDAVAAGIPAAKTVLARAQKAMRAEDRVLRSLDPNDSNAAEEDSDIALGATGPILPRPIVETSNTITLAAMVAEGVGITVLPELAARVSDMAAPEKLVFVPLTTPERHRHIGVITRKSKSLSPIARLFLDQVIALAPKQDLPASLTWY
ncbi:LysR family transcriptional regulator [Thalassospira indica]|uniref:LysR family transcriptional regulator n=1 Tax=Thalassospira indica TaxID=1891279 RepID=A0ABM6XY21_9PROT|nr:LysR family transcriptional regulator [Thalassospira indica]AXO14580.1 LysR family transcriptional regulator [Thalassospira indica]OAZ10013.1 LysR family transcriptional regulator [Thalassospira profundimaris]